MKVFRLLVAIVFLVIGLVAGVQNTDQLTLNFLSASVRTSSGVAIMLSLLLGVVSGALIVMATMVWPLYSRLRRLDRDAVRAADIPPSSAGA